MAKSFSNIKKGLSLLDIIQIGKYKGCRVDSIIEQDDDYLRYMQKEKILVFDKSVMDALTNKYSVDSIAINNADVRAYNEELLRSVKYVDERFNPHLYDDYNDDIPF